MGKQPKQGFPLVPYAVQVLHTYLFGVSFVTQHPEARKHLTTSAAAFPEALLDQDNGKREIVRSLGVKDDPDAMVLARRYKFT